MDLTSLDASALEVIPATAQALAVQLRLPVAQSRPAGPAGSRAAAWSPHHSNESESDISDTGTIAPSHWAPGEPECPSQKLKIIQVEPAGDHIGRHLQEQTSRSG